mgnify:CR=1 FL=1
MANIHRLPNGYGKAVKDKKHQLSVLISNMENLKDAGGYAQSLETKLESFAMHVMVTNKYYYKGTLHIAFDSDFISAEVMIDEKGRWRLWPSCTVFIKGTEDFYDNYKW